VSLKEWWLDLKDLLSTARQPKSNETLVPRKPFQPLHASQPEGKPQPEWPPKDERK
jgi:hypothetical protein